MRNKILLCAVSLISISASAKPKLRVSSVAAAEKIRVTKHSKFGTTATRTTLMLNNIGKGKCFVSLETDLGRSDEKEAGPKACERVTKLIAGLKVTRDKRYVDRYCAASYQVVEVLGRNEKYYCLKGTRTDGKMLVALNQTLGAISAKNLEVDF